MKVSSRLAWLALALAVLPIVVATARAFSSDWVPIGDNAFFALRARDVLTEHHPLLGTWTSASDNVGRDISNPGPLQFDLLAVPAKLSATIGVAVGTALLNIASVVGIAVITRRRGGPVVQVAALAMAVALVWTMGSELLFDPWQPHALLLPFLFFAMLGWSMMAGEFAALPIAVGVGSFVVQTHLSYVFLVATVGGAAAAVLAVRAWRAPGPVSRRPSLLRAIAVSIVVGALCWSQPVIEQLQHGRDGNLYALASTAGDGGPAVGWSLGARLVASVVSVPPFWGRPSFEERLVTLGLAYLPSAAAAVASLVIVAGVLALCGWRNLRVRDGLAGAAVAVAAVALATAVLTAAILPLNGFGIGIAAHQLRWLWPVGALVWFAVALTLARMVAARSRQAVAVGFTVLVALLSGLALPGYNAKAGPAADAASIPSVRRLAAGLGSLEGKGPFLFEVETLRFAEPFSTPTMAEMQRRGIEFRVSDGGWIHQLGRSRALRPGEPVEGRLVLQQGDLAFAPQPGRLVTRVVGLDREQHGEMLRLRDEVFAHVVERGLRLNDRGRDALAVRVLLDFAAAGPVVHDLGLVSGDELALIVREDLGVIDRSWRARFRRYVELQQRWDKQTIALFLEPPPR